MLFILLACASNTTSDAGTTRATCDTREAFGMHAAALRELADMRELCGFLENPYDISPCFAPVPAMPDIGHMITCEQHRDAAVTLRTWLESSRQQFEAHCHANKSCRDAQVKLNGLPVGAAP